MPRKDILQPGLFSNDSRERYELASPAIGSGVKRWRKKTEIPPSGIEYLRRFIPKKQREMDIEIIDILAPVVERMTHVLPPRIIWEFYSSAPSKTGDKINFPYCRVDAAVVNSTDRIAFMTEPDLSPNKARIHYKIASFSALKALVWVEIGFQGLENLAASPASKSWTSAVGHDVNDKERAIAIMSRGKQLYEKCLRGFVNFRNSHGITDDCFTEYGLEYLLEPFSTTPPALQIHSG